jgi:RHS repeat-associated protein
MGAVEEESDYYPFGTEVVVTGPGVNELKFAGKRRDSESQLDYFGARYYGNALGRFTSVDPKVISKQRMFDPQQWTMYSYARNNPMTYIDPDGRELKMVVFLEGEKGNDTYTKNGVMRAANAIHNVGVKNVTVEFRSGKPDSKTLSGLNKDHITVFRVQDPSEKSLAAKGMEAGLGGTAVGQSEKTTNVVHIYPTGSGFEGWETREVSNVVKHEELHQAGESFLSDLTPNNPGNVMDPDSYNRMLEDKDLKIDPSYQGAELRNKFNSANEVDSNPQGAKCVGGCPSEKEKKEPE